MKTKDGKKDKCTVLVVTNKYRTVKTVESVEIYPVGNITLKAGESITLTANCKPHDAKKETIKWSTEDTDLITVNEKTGEVTAKKNIKKYTDAQVNVRTGNGKTDSKYIWVKP